jgi:hypothetical protein
MTTPTTPIVEDPRKVAIRRAVIFVIVLACIGGLVLAASRTRRGEAEFNITGGNTGVVELLTPRDGDTLVNQQAQVGVDLTSAYDANLVINGTLIPEDQVIRRPELNAVYFLPGPGKVIERLPPGRNTINALVFRLDGKQAPSAVTWTFNVA